MIPSVVGVARCGIHPELFVVLDGCVLEIVLVRHPGELLDTRMFPLDVRSTLVPRHRPLCCAVLQAHQTSIGVIHTFLRAPRANASKLVQIQARAL